MVHEVTKFFGEAFVIALAIFLSGLFLGLMLDAWRADEVRADMANIEAEWADITQFSQLVSGTNTMCTWALKEVLLFNNRLYKEGEKIEEYEAANKLTETIEAQKRRYIALKVQFLFLIEKLKRECNFPYHIVIHFYKRYHASKEELAMDRATADALLDTKYACGNRMILVPLQTDLNLMTIDYLVRKYKIHAFPAVVIDGNVIAQGRIVTREELQKLLGC